MAFKRAQHRRMQGVVEIGDPWDYCGPPPADTGSRSLVPTDKKSTRRPISLTWYTAAGTSIIAPTGGRFNLVALFLGQLVGRRGQLTPMHGLIPAHC